VRELFRKHGKIIMTIISIMLMFIFALPTFRNQSALERQSAAYGHLNGKKISNDEVASARAELQVLRELGFLESDANGRTWIERFCGEESQSGIYWLLICADAARYTSVSVTPDEVLKILADKGLADNEVDVKLSQHGINRKILAAIVSRLEMVYSFQNLLASIPQPISALELEADRELRRVQIHYVPVDATQGWDKLADDAIIAAQITAQFEAYKNVLATPIPGPADAPTFLGFDVDDKGEYALVGYPGSVDAALHVRAKDIIPWDGTKVEQLVHRGDILGINAGQVVNAPFDALVVSGGGRSVMSQIPRGYDLHGHTPADYPAEVGGHHFPFGYKFPDRVKVEYLKFERAAVRSRLTPTDADVAAAFKEFKAKPFKFRPEMAAATAPGAGLNIAAPTESQPATAQATQPAATRSAQEILTDWDDVKVRDPFINEQLDLRVTALLKKMVDSARNKTDVPWKTAATVERANWLDYKKVAEDVARDPNFSGYKALTGDTGAAFLGAAELQDAAGLGRAVYSTTQGLIFDFPTMAVNIEELVTPDKRQALGRLGLQLGHEAPEVTDKDGNVYLFRVTDFQKAHVPATIDEENTRAKVGADCKKLAAYNGKVKEIKDTLAKNDDLAELAKQYQSAVQYPKEFNRDESAASVDVQFIRDFVKTAFSLPEPAAGKPPSVTTLENEQWLRVYPMKLIRVLPASGADFGAQRIYLYRQPDPAVITFVQDYLQIEKLAERLKFTPMIAWGKKGAP